MRTLACALLSLCWLSGLQAAEFADTDGLLVEYDFRHQAPVQAGSAPLIRLFGDGRLEVAIPWYRKRAGFYEGQLAPAELQQLLGEIVESGVPDMTRESLLAAQREAKSQSTELVHVSKRELSRFSFALAGAKTVTNLSWENLREDVRLPGAKSGNLGTLWTIDRRLNALAEHPSLKIVAAMQPPRRLAR